MDPIIDLDPILKPSPKPRFVCDSQKHPKIELRNRFAKIDSDTAHNKCWTPTRGGVFSLATQKSRLAPKIPYFSARLRRIFLYILRIFELSGVPLIFFIENVLQWKYYQQKSNMKSVLPIVEGACTIAKIQFHMMFLDRVGASACIFVIGRTRLHHC